jgi:hypothetical protein
MASEEVGRLVDTIRQWDRIDSSCEMVSFCDQLLAVYQSADAEDRSLMRGAVEKNRFVWNAMGENCLWNYLGRIRQNRDATSVLRSSLIICALTYGLADWRDTIVWLEELWDEAKQSGIDPRPHFDEIAEMADTENLHGISRMSTNGLFINAIYNRTHDAELLSQLMRLMEKHTPNRTHDAERHSYGTPLAKGHTPKRPWWKFWDWHRGNFDLRQ